MREIADSVGAVFMVDMAHFAGLVAGKVFTGDFNPIPFAHIVTSTSHKTLRGPRGGFVLCSQEFSEAVDKGCPLVLGGPLPHVLAAKAIAFQEANRPDFQQYSQRIVDNASSLADELTQLGEHVLTGAAKGANGAVISVLKRIQVNVAAGDVNGDGLDEIITAPAKGTKSEIKVFGYQGNIISQFFAYEAEFFGGVKAAACDINNDGKKEIIAGPGAGGGPQVKIFSLSGRLISQFFAYNANSTASCDFRYASRHKAIVISLA